MDRKISRDIASMQSDHDIGLLWLITAHIPLKETELIKALALGHRLTKRNHLRIQFYTCNLRLL